MNESSLHNPNHPYPGPLVVDLDGTLVATDTLKEQLLEIAGRSPGGLPQALGALSRHRAGFKQTVAGLAELDPAALPYRTAVLELIQWAKDRGRPVILASASHESTVQAVADHLGLFDAVIATSGSVNQKGKDKLQSIRDVLTDCGWGGLFDYVGDSEADLPIWSECQTAYLVNAKPALAKRVQASRHVVELVPPDRGAMVELWRAGRPHQWCKNLLLAVPFLSAQRADEFGAWGAFLLAFFAFSLCASAVYLVNDLLDLRADRLHPTKRFRPMAAGRLNVSVAALAAPLLVAFAVTASAIFLPTSFVWALLVYTATAWLYSFVIKHRTIIDVVWLACLYTLRVIAGGEATGTEASPWLLALALFLFLSIALAKRYAELRLLASKGREDATGRSYHVDDQQLLSVMGISSGMLGVLVLALYIQSDKVARFYEQPEVLWIVCPVMLYWVGRLWVRAHRRLMRDDPLLFALTDRVSYIVALLIVLAAMVAN